MSAAATVAGGLAFVMMLGAGCGLSEIPVERASVVPPAGEGGGGGAGPGGGGGAGGVPAPDGGAGGGGGGPAAGQVTINGRSFARDRVVVFLHIGHSNMAGRAEVPDSDRPYHYDPHPQLWAYARGGQWRAAVEPLSPDSMTRGRAGPGMSILRTALDLAPPGAQIISIGHGHSGQTGGYCRNFRKGGLLYDLVMAPAVELRGKVTFGAIFTMFGISEVNDEDNIPRFGECLEAVARDMRADLGDPGLPFVIGEWEAGAEGDAGPDGETGVAIIPQMKAAAGRIPRSVLIPTEGLEIQENDHHFTLVAHRIWAGRGFAALKAANLLPWAAR